MAGMAGFERTTTDPGPFSPAFQPIAIDRTSLRRRWNDWRCGGRSVFMIEQLCARNRTALGRRPSRVLLALLRDDLVLDLHVGRLGDDLLRHEVGLGPIGSVVDDLLRVCVADA